MADPFAAALAALFNAPGSLAATYTPVGGQSVAIRVIRSQGSDAGAGRFDRTVSDVNMFDMRRADVAKPARGATIAISDPVTGESLGFSINGAPVLDVEGLTWTCPVQPI